MARKRPALLDKLTRQFDEDVAAAQEARGDPPAIAIDTLTRQRNHDAFDAPLPGMDGHPMATFNDGFPLPTINGIAYGGQGLPGFDWKPDNLTEAYGPDPTPLIRQAKAEMEKLELKDRELYEQRDKAQSITARANIEKKIDASNIAWQRLAWFANPDVEGEPLTIQCRTRTPMGRCDGMLWRTEIAAQAGRCLGCINTLYDGRT